MSTENCIYISFQQIHSLALRACIGTISTMPKKFNDGEPLAYFLTWTTYGTWLPGDERGWNRKDELADLPGNRVFNEAAESNLKETPFCLSDSDREIVESTVRKHCSIRNWELYALSVRSNHVHAVVTAENYKPDTVASQFKAWCTRNLKCNYPRRERYWTEGASQRWINQESELRTVVKYTLEAQDRKGVE